MMQSQTNRRIGFIDLLKVILSVGIVFRHAELVGCSGISTPYDILNKGMMLLTSVCVPLFYALSGFLFFRNAPQRMDMDFFVGKWKNRVSSLLVPYLIANVVAFVCYWLAYRFFPEMMSGFFGDDWKNPLFVFWTGPVNLSLWFIRDLIIACLMAPLFWLLVRYTRIWGVLALGAVWYFVGGSPWYNFYFALGAWAAICHGDYVRYHLGRIHSHVSDDAPAWSFFMYLYHYIPALIFKKLLIAWVAPSSFITLALTYLAVVILTLGVVSSLFRIIKQVTPRFTGVLVGGKL